MSRQPAFEANIISFPVEPGQSEVLPVSNEHSAVQQRYTIDPSKP